MSSRLYRIGALASGGGTNFQAILDGCLAGDVPAAVAVVISNNSGSGALERARSHDIPAVHLSARTHPEPARLDAAIESTLRTHGVDLVVLAGYMKKLGPRTLDAFAGRILNIHPSLLPAFGGKGMYGDRVHAAVLASGARESGATVHLVEGEYDTGPIVAQKTVPVCQNDTAETLAARVLKAEHALYPEVVRLFATGRARVEAGRVRIASKGEV